MAWPPLSHQVTQWQNDPSQSTPLDKTHLEAAEQDLADYVVASIQDYDAYLVGRGLANITPLWVAKPSGDTTGVTDQAAIQAAIDAADTAGGGVVYLLSGTYTVGQHPTQTNCCLYLRSKVALVGAGEGTVIQATNSLPAAVHFIVTTDAGFYGTGIHSLRIDGNASNANLTAGVQWYDTSFHGPWSFSYNIGTVYSGHFHRMTNVTISNLSSATSGLYSNGVACCFVADCFFFECVGGGIFDQGSDNVIVNVTVGGATNGYGISIGASCKLSNAKIYTSGNGPTQALALQGNNSQAANCEIQETTADGVGFAGSGASFLNGVVNSSGKAVVFGTAASNNTFEGQVRSQNLSSGNYVPACAVRFGNKGGGVAGAGNIARVQTYGAPTNFLSGDPTGQLVQFNDQGSGGSQLLAYAGTVTPDAYAGDTVVIGTLTGAITIANPTNGGHRGSKLTFVVTQDTSGGRTVTWGTGYVLNAALATTASTTISITFTHDGLLWKESGRTSTATPSTPGYVSTVLGEASLVSLWRCNELGGGVAYDSKGVLDATLNPGVTFGVAGEGAGVDTAITLDGTGAYLRPNALTGIPSGATARTFEAWVKRTGTGNSQTLFHQRTNSGQSVTLYAGGSGDQFFTDGVNGGNNLTYSSAYFTVGAWVHFAFTIDGSSNWVLYINGASAQSGTFGTAINTGTLNAIGMGALADGQNYLPATVNELAIYNTALAAGRITAHYAAR